MPSLLLLSDVGCVSLCRWREERFRKYLGFENWSEFKFLLVYLLVVWPELELDPVVRIEWTCREWRCGSQMMETEVRIPSSQAFSETQLLPSWVLQSVDNRERIVWDAREIRTKQKYKQWFMGSRQRDSARGEIGTWEPVMGGWEISTQERREKGMARWERKVPKGREGPKWRVHGIWDNTGRPIKQNWGMYKSLSSSLRPFLLSFLLPPFRLLSFSSSSYPSTPSFSPATVIYQALGVSTELHT